MKILYMVFHPDLANSRVNSHWFTQVTESGKVHTIRDMYAQYPDFQIDVAEEQELLMDHDRIVFQFPFYWYNMTALMKKYFDDVFTYNFAFGRKGVKLQGKELQLVISVGGPHESYMPGGYNNFSITEYLRPLQQTANLAKMVYLPPIWMHRSGVATEPQVHQFGQTIIEQLDDPERADPWAVQKRIEKELEAVINA